MCHDSGNDRSGAFPYPSDPDPRRNANGRMIGNWWMRVKRLAVILSDVDVAEHGWGPDGARAYVCPSESALDPGGRRSGGSGRAADRGDRWLPSGGPGARIVGPRPQRCTTPFVSGFVTCRLRIDRRPWSGFAVVSSVGEVLRAALGDPCWDHLGRRTHMTRRLARQLVRDVNAIPIRKGDPPPPATLAVVSRMVLLDEIAGRTVWSAVDDGEFSLHAGIEMGFDCADDLIGACVRSGEGQSLGGSGFNLVFNVDKIGE